MLNITTPSSTMQAVCAVRVDNAKIIGEDEIASDILKSLPEARKFRNELDIMSKGNFTRTIIMRSRFFSDALKKYESQFQQLVVLCSGLDFRYLNSEVWKERPVFLIDHPASLELMKQLTVNHVDKFKNTKMIPVDLVQIKNDTIRESLINNGFNPDLATLILWEGATYYFKPEVVYSILDSTSSLCNTNNIIIDFANEGSFMQKIQQKNQQSELTNKEQLNQQNSIEDKDDELLGVKNTMSLLKKKQEPWCGFFRPVDVDRHLKKVGYNSVETIWDSKLEEEYFGEVKMVHESMFYVHASKLGNI